MPGGPDRGERKWRLQILCCWEGSGSARIFSSTGPSSFGGRILVLLKEKGKMTQRELTQILERKPATLSEQLENMEKSAWIVRKKCPCDKRNLEISLTQLGEEMAREAERERQQEADELFGLLDKDDREKLYEILGKLGDDWKSKECRREEALL